MSVAAPPGRVPWANVVAYHLLLSLVNLLNVPLPQGTFIPRRSLQLTVLDKDVDPNSIDFLVTGVYQFRVGVRRSGSTDTLTSADFAFRKDGVSV